MSDQNSSTQEILDTIEKKAKTISYKPKANFKDIQIAESTEIAARLQERIDIDSLDENILFLKNTWFLDYDDYKEFDGTKGKVKKLVHKFCKFYMESLTACASEFHGNATAAIIKLNEELNAQKELIEKQNKIIAELEERLNSNQK